MNSIKREGAVAIRALRESGCTHKPILYTGDQYKMGCRICGKIVFMNIDGKLVKRIWDICGESALSYL